MKVGELLSGPTLTSSRTLTVFAATVILAVWTGADPKKLLFFAGPEINQTNIYWLLFVLLSFLSVVHLVNWFNDFAAEEKKRLSSTNDAHMRRRQHEQSTTAWLNDTGVGKIETRRQLFEMGDAEANASAQIKSAIETEAAEIRSRKLNYAIQFGLHIGVPLSLAIAAGIGLLCKLL